MTITLNDLLRRNANNWPEQIAAADADRTFSYRELEEKTGVWQHYLSDQGIGKGDIVAFLGENRPEYLMLLFALARLGAVLLPLNFRLVEDELSYILKHSQAKGLLYSDSYTETAQALHQKIDTLAWCSSIEQPSEVTSVDLPATSEVDVVASDPMVVMYTSGTTGRPKGCLQSHRALLATIGNYNNNFGLDNVRTHLVAVPLFHVGGLGSTMATLGAAGTCVFCPEIREDIVFSLIEKYQVESILFTPPTVRQLATSPLRKEFDISSLKVMIGPSGMESAETLALVRENLGVKFFGIYGQTEAAGAIITSSDEELKLRSNSYGHEQLYYAARIVDDQGKDVDEGELILRGPTLMSGYLHNEEATQAAFREGWYYTGDVFRRESDGSLTMKDRKKYLIKTGGENVYPSEIELPLREHPAIVDVCVLGVTDEHWGEKVVAFVQQEENQALSEEQLSDYLRTKVARYKVPKQWLMVSEIPRNHSGKVLRDALLEQL